MIRFIALAFCLLVTPALAAEPSPQTCPPGAPSCKVITLTPTELNALIGEKMVLQTAKEARPLDLGQIVQYFFTKLSAAPAGTVVKPPEKSSEKKAPPAGQPSAAGPGDKKP